MKKIETKSVVLLQHHLKALKLPTILAECQKIASRCAADNVDHLGFLLQLCELELIDREKRAAERRLKAARFPTFKTLDFSPCRIFMSGAAPFAVEAIEAFEAIVGKGKVLELYGMTETTVFTMNPTEGPKKIGSVGIPIPAASLPRDQATSTCVWPGSPFSRANVRR